MPRRARLVKEVSFLFVSRIADKPYTKKALRLSESRRDTKRLKGVCPNKSYTIGDKTPFKFAKKASALAFLRPLILYYEYARQ